LLSYWKRKAPLKSVLLDELDGRTLVGLERVIKRMAKDKAKDSAKVNPYNFLCNYSTLLEIAAKLTVEQIKISDEGLLAPMLKAILAETDLPNKTLEALYDKRLDALVARRCYAEALDIQNPLKVSEQLDPMHLRVSDFSADMVFKCDKFGEVTFTKLLPPMLAQGESLGTAVLELCRLGLNAYADVDYVTVDSHFRKAMVVWRHLWNALLAIITYSCKPCYVDNRFVAHSRHIVVYVVRAM
jgi:hypothetical protein